MPKSCAGKNPKRIAMYVIYDKDGILDGYRKYYLQELRKHVDYIVGVVSGTLTPESRDELSALTDDFFVRENKGLLAGSWLDGLAHIGWDTLDQYDELLMLNDSFFGPFYDLSDMFSAMEESDADFYGALRNYENKEITELHGRKFKHGYLRGSICYFYVIKEKLLHSPEFKKYWGRQPDIKEDWDTFFFSEFDFYDYVIDAGFKVDSYQGGALEGYCNDSLSLCMRKLVENEKNPFMRIRPLTSDMQSYALQVGYGNDARLALEYIDKQTDYDVNLIWDYILRTKNLRYIWQQLQLEYVVGKNSLDTPYNYSKPIAVILHIYYEDLVERISDYCENFPDRTKFFVTAVEKSTKDKIEDVFSRKGLNYVCTVRPNVGVAMSSLWVTYANVVLSGEFEYIFYFHDKKSPYGSYGLIHGDQFGERCYQSLAGSKCTIMNIINLFESNPRMGVLGPPTVYHGDYFFSPWICWAGNYQNTVDLGKRLNLHVDISPDIAPVAPYGDMFWFRASALKKVIGIGLTYKDFDIPYKPDNTFMHAIERIYGFAAQDSGYYYAEVIDSDSARSDLVNYQYIIDQLMRIPLSHGQFAHNLEIAKYIISEKYHNYDGINTDSKITRKLIKENIKRKIPKPIWAVMKKVYHFFGGKKWVG